MSLRNIEFNGFLSEEVLEDIGNVEYPQYYCFLLGAGASQSSGIPTGQDMVDIWERGLEKMSGTELKGWKKEKGITEDNKYSFYSQYYKFRYPDPKKGKNFLIKKMENAIPSIGYVLLANILSRTEHKVVITTNFDSLTEDTLLDYESVHPRVIEHENMANFAMEETTRPLILKIHHGLLYAPLNTSDELKELEPNWEPILDKVFRKYHPIFIGYAGNDRSVMEFLKRNAEKFRKGKWRIPYWLTYRTSAEKVNVDIKKFLNDSDGYLIQAEDFDTVMLRLWYVMIYNKLPDENEVLNENKFMKRYERGSKKGNLKSQEVRNKFKNYLDNNANYHNMLAIKQFRMRQYEDAEKEYRRAVELDPDHASYHFELAIVLNIMSRYEEAEKEYRRAVELDPDNTFYHWFFGNMLYKMKRYEDAEKEYRRVVELAPDTAWFHDDLGKTLRAIGRYEEAEEEKRRAEELRKNGKW